MPLRRTLVLLALLLAAPGAGAHAQDLYATRPFLDWQTIETEHFVFHFPAELRPWTLSVAARMEPVHAAVTALVGYAPPRRVTVVVEDPSGVSNGFAIPLLNRPAIYLWPTPPDPTSQIGSHRGWGEVLSVHEYAHVAHLTRPSRNPLQRLIWRVVPAELGPITRRAPRWVFEGYATFVEGRLTGSGRPHGVWRPALLREWALQGQLPSYTQLNATGGYKRGSLAYLAGSAFIEWLVARDGDSSVVHLWRRMTARQDRGFDAAFIGVYGDAPADLYGRFTAELTGKALQIEEQLTAAGLARGEIVQRLTENTGEPALSRDGARMAVVLRERDRPSRLVVWQTDSEPESPAERRARERLVQRDPEDVPAVRRYPRPKRALATLQSVGGRGHTFPRFFLDGRRILVVRSEPVGDGTLRPDLFVWEWERGRLTRVTHGAGVRQADPAPDGRRAAGVRCLAGICDLVAVDLASGAVRVLAAGSPTRTFHRPRWSPDGRTIAVGVQDAGDAWRVALVDAPAERGGPMSVRATPRFVTAADSVNRHSAAFLPDGGALVLVSEAGGIPNVARLDLATGATRPLTRVASAVYAPEPSPRGAVYFLHEHPRGLDINRIALDGGASLDSVVAVSPRLAPAAQLPVERADSFPATPLPAPHGYGLGPRRLTLLPAGSVATEGAAATLALVGTDPVGRLGVTLQGAFGDRSAWRGAALGAEYRRFRPVFRGDLFYAEHRPTRQGAGTFAPRFADVDYTGAVLGGALLRDFGDRRHRYQLGATVGRVSLADADPVRRRLAYAEYRGGYAYIRGRRAATLAVDLHGATGTTGASDWQRALVSATVGASVNGRGVRGTVTYGAVSHEAPPFEQFLVGGVRPPLFDASILSQRVAMPALPVGIVQGRELYAYRVTAAVGGLLEPYYAGIGARGGFHDAFRLVGAEREFALGSIALVGLPALRVLGGVAYTLDAPFKHKTRGYFALTYRP